MVDVGCHLLLAPRLCWSHPNLASFGSMCLTWRPSLVCVELNLVIMHTYYTYIYIIYCIKYIYNYPLYIILYIYTVHISIWLDLVGGKNLTKHRHWAFDNLKPPLGCQLPINRIQQDHGRWCHHWLENIRRIMGCTRFTPKFAKAPTLAPDPAALTPHLPPEEFMEKGLDGWKLQHYPLVN